MTKLEKLIAQKDELIQKMEGIVNASEDALTDEQQTEFDTAKADLDKVNTSIEACEQLEEAKATKKEAEVKANRPAPRASISGERVISDDSVTKTSSIILPSTARKSHNLKAFDTNENAYAFGQFILARLGSMKSSQWCYDHGINSDKFAAITGDAGSAGALIPEQFSDDIAKLTYNYGVARKYCNVRQMTTDTSSRPKTSAGLTAYFMGENATNNDAIAASSKTYSNIPLTAKTLGIITAMTKNLSEDAIISIADDLLDDMALQFAAKEDDCLFNGTGAAGTTYGGITGLANAGINSSTVSGLDIDINILRSVIAKISSAARLGARWYVNPTIFDTVFAPIADAAGGNTTVNLANGVSYTQFAGYPVVLTDSLSASPAAGEYFAYFGNLGKAVDFGDRQQTAIDITEYAVVGGESMFEREQIAVKGTERIDINVHSVGANGEPNPIAGIKLSS